MKKEIVIRTDDDRQRFVRWVNLFDLEKPVLFTVERFRKKHSRSQRGLYRLWLGEIANETGNDTDELHNFFKLRYLVPEEKTILGEATLVYSTRNLTTVEYGEFMMKVEVFTASELGIVLSQPEASGWR